MQNYQILVCEDEVEIGNAIEIYLKNQGYGVHRAYNGKEGLEVLARQTIHLAIVDLMMPVMDGLTMIMTLRQSYDFPVIVLSAKSEDMDKITGLNMGADDYITKPFTPMELLARVNSQLRRYACLLYTSTANVALLMVITRYLLEQKCPPKQGVLIVLNAGEEGLGNLKGCRRLMQDYADKLSEVYSFDGSYKGYVNKAVGSRWV